MLEVCSGTATHTYTLDLVFFAIPILSVTVIFVLSVPRLLLNMCCP